jgi:hypothetical protein
MRQSACDDRPLGQGVALANEMLVEDDLNSGALIEVVPSDIRLCGYYFGVVTLTASKCTSGRIGRRTGSGSNVGHSFPFRHGVEAVQMGGRGGAAGARWNEKIADGREDTDEPLQVPG